MSSLAKKAAPLAEQLKRDEAAQYAQARSFPREKTKRIEKRVKDQEEEDIVKLSQKESAKILDLARDQLVNVESNMDDDAFRKKKRTRKAKQREEDDSSIDDDDEAEQVQQEDEDEEEEEETGDNVFAEIDEADERAIAAFSKKEQSGQPRKTLGEIILEKLAEVQAKKGELDAGGDQQQPKEAPLNPQVVEVYTSVGQLMSRYRAGKVPKAFKIIPALKDWERILALTEPDRWTPQAMYQATRLFASNMNPRMAQKFYASVLVPAVRDDIQSNRSLNYHLYMSLKKAIYKPASFFKGVLFPLCEEDCSLREAAIVSSVLAKVSVPVVHSGAALLRLAQMPYNGATSVFMRVLINKKYSLPYRVVDSLVNHFCSFVGEKRELPVLWHQALLVLVQRYKGVFSPEQKERMKALLKAHVHKALTPEIRRELFYGQQNNNHRN